MDKIVTVPAGLCGLYDGARVKAASEMGALYGRVRRVNSEWWDVNFDGGGMMRCPLDELELLLDSALSMCHVAQSLAGRRGVKVEDWACLERDTSVDTMRRYSLPQYILRADGKNIVTLLDSPMENQTGWNREKVVFVEGLADAESYADVVRLACLKFGGTS